MSFAELARYMFTRTIPKTKKPDAVTIAEGLPERRYLPELHGVRGLALLGVVVFHLFGNGRISGGIDIFLAVTGFLFTGMLLREAAVSGGRINPFKYFGRLVRRIFIPAAVVVIVTLIVGLIISPATQHRQLWSEARASFLYFENFELINSQLAYGAAGPETSPFQHFWSLSVQGQFYLIWPLVAIISVLIAKKAGISAARIMGILIGIIFVCSFIYAIHVGGHSQDEAYLMTTTRAWEIAFGGLLALAGGALRLPKRARFLAGWVGVALIVLCGLILDGAALFPGPWALWPLAGLMLVLIAAGPLGGKHDPRGSATRFLSNRLLSWVGDHAYGLYLWHWPLLIYYMEMRDREAVGLKGAAVILAVSGILSVLLHKYVEQPLAQVNKQKAPTSIWSNKPVIALGGGAMLVVLVTTTVLAPSHNELKTAYGDLDQNVHPGAAEYFANTNSSNADVFPAVEDAAEFKQDYLQRDCAQETGEAPGTDEITVCEDEEAPEQPTATIVLAGGSHAGHLEEAFKALGRKYDWEVLVVLKHSCVFGGEQYSNQTMCGAWNENFVDWLGDNDVDLVVTPGSRIDPRYDSEYIIDSAPYWWDEIAATDTDLMLVRGTPRHEQSIPDCLASDGSSQECGPPKDKFLETNPLLDMDLDDRVHVTDLTPYVCPRIDDSTAENCDAVVGNILVWFDKSHFTTPFSQSLAPGVEAEVEKVLPHLVR